MAAREKLTALPLARKRAPDKDERSMLSVRLTNEDRARLWRISISRDVSIQTLMDESVALLFSANRKHL